ncbi:hypothetical protein [Defluviimonas sp. SAOS-178_SWC]|uniref:hypothetical protein n=1 Tax=Defluviimonas sp. SAOS-178_SWC TaxID=3121287 RepID=UPI003221CF4F
MSARNFRRKWSALFMIFLLASCPSLATGQEQGKIVPGADILKARCIFCHSPMLMLALVRRYTENAGYDGLDAFLSKHHAPDIEGREAIVTFLSKLPHAD